MESGKRNSDHPGEGPELINDSKFEDHVEFNWTDTNSGVYLRGRYEVQIETDSADEAMHHTGSVYGFIVPKPEFAKGRRMANL